MSDFLSNLATRTLGLEPSVRPRLPALFGPPNEGAFGPAPSPSGLEQESAEEKEFQTSQFSRPRQRMVANMENSRPETSRTIPTFNRPAIAATATERWQESASLTPNRSRESVASAVASVVAPTEIRPLAARDDLSAPTPIISAVSPSSPMPPEHIVRESVREIFRTEVSVPTEITRIKNLAAPQSAEAPARVMPHPPAVSPFAPHIKPAAPAVPTFDEKPDQAAPQPTIQVTIGRIEVRATAAPTRKPTTAATPTNAALSLDDYLRERAGGQR